MVCAGPRGNSANELLQNATFAENYAKESGGARFRLYEPDLHQRNRALRDLEQQLPRAMEAGELYLEYQPMIDLATGRAAELEALVRWRHPDEGLVSPELFIAAAEKTGVILAVGSWILDGVCAQISAWRSQGLPEMPVSVNISAKEFESGDFIESIRAALRRHGVEPSLLQLEITERTVIERVEESISRLQELRDMGMRISIDDFGIGYSSLSYLVRLPVDTLKIDKSFIQNLETGKQEKAIVTAIIAMGTSLGLTIVTEGIETEEQLAWLRRFPCQLGQGYLFSRPRRGDDPELLARLRGATPAGSADPVSND
jgi:EAL domain-containing protein (putative c-di-GMP-specific phosphodiesterase class I)